MRAIAIVSLWVAFAASYAAGQTSPAATHQALVERLSEALPVKELVGLPDTGSLSRSDWEAVNPGRESDIRRLFQRQQACREPLAGAEVLHGLAIAALDATLTDSQLADIVAVVESPDFALMVEMMRSEPLGADIPPPMLEAAKRTMAQPGFRLFAKTIGQAIGGHLRKPEVNEGLAACDDRLMADLAAAGLKPGE